MALLAFVALPLAAQPRQSALHAAIAIPSDGPVRHLNVDVQRGGEGLVLVGCVTDAPEDCATTRRVPLSQREALELMSLVAAMEARMRCPPPAGEPEDIAFTIRTRGARGGTFEGALPRSPANVAERTSGGCAASARLAWWIVQRFGG